MSLEDLNELIYSKADGTYILKIPGVCFFCTNLVNGIPPIIRNYVQLVGSLHQVMVIVTVRTLPIKWVFVVSLHQVMVICGISCMGPHGVYLCLVQYGCKDMPSLEGSEFVDGVLTRLKDLEESAYEIDEAVDRGGVVFVMGRTIVAAKESSSWFSKLLIRYLYAFMRTTPHPLCLLLRFPPTSFSKLVCYMRFEASLTALV